jgi:hypothetical protein
MNARELETVGALLERRRSRAREEGLIAVLCVALAAASAPIVLGVTVALLAGAAGAAFLSAVNHLSRKDTIARLALDPSAYAIEEVRRYGERLVHPAQRERLASWLREIVREAPIAGNWYLSDRVLLHRGQLESLAAELAASWAHVRPASAVACHHLLTHAVESPLYNEAVPAEELPALIERIRRGISA